MEDATFSNSTPQFGTAEYTGPSGNDSCQFCHLPILGPYYRVNSARTCATCAELTRDQLSKDTHAAYVRGLLFGIGAAIVGMILYATFVIVTSIEIGYAALAVGWMIGKAMITGSGGVGGRRYQIAAVLLTYAAVSTAAIPVALHYRSEHPSARHTNRKTDTSQIPDDLDAPQEQQPTPSRPSPFVALGMLAFLGLASPFLELTASPISGLIGLVILFVGMRFAWRFTAGRSFDLRGPFDAAAPPSH